VLCNLIGRDVERGELPNDESLLGPMIRNICHRNAKRYLALPDLKTAKRTTEVIRTPEGNRRRG
jgi:glucuronate isomerase